MSRKSVINWLMPTTAVVSLTAGIVLPVLLDGMLGMPRALQYVNGFTFGLAVGFYLNWVHQQAPLQRPVLPIMRPVGYIHGETTKRCPMYRVADVYATGNDDMFVANGFVRCPHCNAP